MCCEGGTRAQADRPDAVDFHCSVEPPSSGASLSGLLLISLLAGIIGGVGVLLFSGSWLVALVAYVGIGNLVLVVSAFATGFRSRRTGGAEKYRQ